MPGLAAAQARLGYKVDLMATTNGAPETHSENGLVTRTFPLDWPESLCASEGLRNTLRHEAADVIHHHALWLRTLHYAHEVTRRRKDRLVVSPRGMMSTWAWNHHRWKKKLARAFVHPGALEDAHGWHATSAEEADDIRRLGFTQPICVVANGVALASAETLLAARVAWQSRCPATRERPVALFYSRFHRKKRLKELLDLWLSSSRGDWLLLLVGVPEEYSVDEVQGWINAAGAREKVTVVDGAGMPAPYAVASLFLLPSHSENFGLVIAEAMAAGVPTLVTDSTPWTALNADDRGWCVPWEKFGDTLRAATAEDAAHLGKRGARARSWVLENFSWEKSARELVEFYGQLQSSGS
ncbi:MAG: glycosyl transferase group 1 [Verrucomicrobia bacterium]|nr:glycosyl transferase group 1 [Verrucomicrobiota bacterium]